MANVAAGDSPAFLDFCWYLYPSLVPMSLSSRTYSRASRPRPHIEPYFANTMFAGAELMVAASVLLGSPPPSGLLVHLVMFFDV